jgi:hypothetical protein
MKTNVEDLNKIRKILALLNNSKMKNIFIFIASFWVLLTSCNSLDSKIIKEYKKQIALKDSCIINISDLIDFKWDKLYFLPDGFTTDLDDFPKAIKEEMLNNSIRYHFFDEWIFTLNDSIVYCEVHSIDIERPTKNEVVFDIPDTSDYQIYTKDKTIFKVIKGEGSIPYYYLQQVE